MGARFAKGDPIGRPAEETEGATAVKPCGSTFHSSLMRYLITGGAGFIGSHLARKLLAEGHEVYIIDNLSTGSMDNILDLKANNKFHYVIDSIFNKSLVAELVDVSDFVFHLAAAVGVMLIVESPVNTIETNIRGTDIILTQASKKKKPVMIASTSEVYGKSNNVPFNETNDIMLGPTIKSRWSYACSKLVDEFLALSYWKERKLPTIIVRLFNTVGPRQTGRYGMVIPRFIDQALSGGPITVYGDGNQSRCFAYVGDVINGMITLSREPKAYGEIFNTGSDSEITINTLAEKVRDLVNPQVKIEHVPYDVAYEAGFEDLPRRIPDLTKIRSLIDYKTTLTIDGILQEVLTWKKGIKT